MLRRPPGRLLLAFALALVVVTAGCSGAGGLGGSGGGGDAVEDASLDGGDGAATAADGAAAPEEATTPVEGDTAQVRERAIIRTGRVNLRVADFDAATRNLTRTVRRHGGFVSDSRVEVNRVGNATYETGAVVLRVPRENFSAVLARVKAVGHVEASSTTSKDVTDRLVDINARLKNLRAERDRLRALYRNASDTEEVLAVEERLSEVQGEIERLEAKRKALRRQVALSTIRVELREPRPERSVPDERQWYETSVVDAFAASLGGVGTTLRALVVAGAYALPYLLAFGLPVAGVGYVARRRRRSGEPAGDAPPPADADAVEDADGTADAAGNGDQPDASEDATGDDE